MMMNLVGKSKVFDCLDGKTRVFWKREGEENSFGYRVLNENKSWSEPIPLILEPWSSEYLAAWQLEQLNKMS